MPKFKAIIFDLGKVIFDLSFDRTFESWATNSGKQLDDIKSKFQFGEVSDMFERGEISAGQFRAEVTQSLDLKITDEDFDKGWCDIYLDTYNGVDDLLVNLKSNYRLVALTNTNIIHNGVWKLKYAETLQHFEMIFSSHELRVRKPEKKFYRLVLDYLKLEPQEIIFLDDNIDNIKGAEELGIRTICVNSYEQMTRELMEELQLDDKIGSI